MYFKKKMFYTYKYLMVKSVNCLEAKFVFIWLWSLLVLDIKSSNFL